MGLFKLHYDNKTNLIIITAILWTFNFRCTFKNVYAHMGMGSFAVLRFDPLLILIKNIICSFYIIGFIYEVKLNKSASKIETMMVQKQENNQILVELQEVKKKDQNDLINTVNKSHNLSDLRSKILFWIKTVSIIFIIYFAEELYFLISNNHVLDRVIIPIRNFGVLLALSIFSPLLIKKSCKFYRHQYIPYIIIFIISLGIIYFNLKDIDRFKKKFGSVNTIIYIFAYFLTGLESTLIKYLVDKQFISIFLILGIKGIIGTFVFIIFNILWNQEEFYAFFEDLLSFEYDYLNEPFEIWYKILYVFSYIILVYFKMYTISQFTENHILSTLMIVDLIYFPFYCFERLVCVKFTISTPSSFIINSIAGVLNFFLMMIFNEILELNFWGLNTNLNRNIINRQKSDYINEDTVDSLIKRDTNNNSINELVNDIDDDERNSRPSELRDSRTSAPRKSN